ncbi:MAG: RNA polymerase sigma factor [Bryobacterales bacterium]|nr:RNA polymerase sigma factor [Bryobacterales bacterium]
MVFRTAYRITGNAADAEDVLQTVFLRLLGKEPGHLRVDEPESYLRRAAVNASIDLIRQRKSTEDASEVMLKSITSDSELSQTLRQALASIEPKHAEIFALRFFEGYTNTEIGQMLGISRITVAVSLHRTRTRLKAELKRG